MAGVSNIAGPVQPAPPNALGGLEPPARGCENPPKAILVCGTYNIGGTAYLGGMNELSAAEYDKPSAISVISQTLRNE